MNVIEDEGSCIVMATSGMLVGGPSVEYLRHLSSNPKNSLIFVSYLGKGSLGRRIQEGITEFSMFAAGKQEVYPLNMGVNTIAGLTGHAGRKELMNYVYRCNPKPRKVILNHGESSKTLDLASSLHRANRIETISPQNLETIRIR